MTRGKQDERIVTMLATTNRTTDARYKPEANGEVKINCNKATAV